MDENELDLEHLEKLRADYATATPRQRLKVIRDRLADDPYNGPNKLVIHVSGIDALARSLVVNHLGRNREERLRAFEDYRWGAKGKPEELVRTYLQLRGVGAPEDFFGAATWRQVRRAIQYRHLLVHDCTFLGANTFVELIQECQRTLEKLVDLGGIKEWHEARGRLPDRVR